MDEEKTITIMRNIPYEQGFHFFLPDGHYTGETATSLCFFQQDLQRTDIESIIFHFNRGDFQKWLNTTVGDEELAKQIDNIDKKLSAEDIQKQLVSIVQKRINLLKTIPSKSKR